ncbi:phage major capsid protein [Candidatus Bandiella euplotis]|uniref:Phage major capsid protein, HK97 family n=1 Tax=Candidatus Bandiella euplotis TaxID=1664265 RepID=A0ABZ0UMR8_9RICK|nr:phage major capsid protein [Candidatus Bandiella woodruffii]WPX96090.1 Putative phage major capsid protein, HK97 family [Candidatus Bandiella woodruffii]
MQTNETKSNKIADLSTAYKVGNAWEQYKAINDRRIEEVEKKGAPDPLTINHLEKINKMMDRMDEMEAVLNRPQMGMHELRERVENREYKYAFCNYIRKGAESDIASLEHKNLSESSERELGYSVTYKVNEQISTLLVQNSPMRQISSVMSISSDALELIEDREDTLSGWSQDSLAGIEKEKGECCHKIDKMLK